MKLVTDTPAVDLELWQEVKHNNEVAFERLYKKFWNPLVNFASLYLPEPSEREEVLQELFIELYVKRHSIKIRSSVASYLISFTRYRILNYLRHRSTYKRHVITAATRLVYCQNHTEEAIDFREAQKRVRRSLSNMPYRYRQVYELNKEYQFTMVKTAQLLNRPIGTVEKQLKKALIFLNDDLTDLVSNKILSKQEKKN